MGPSLLEIQIANSLKFIITWTMRHMRAHLYFYIDKYDDMECVIICHRQRVFKYILDPDSSAFLYFYKKLFILKGNKT